MTARSQTRTGTAMAFSQETRYVRVPHGRLPWHRHVVTTAPYRTGSLRWIRIGTGASHRGNGADPRRNSRGLTPIATVCSVDLNTASAVSHSARGSAHVATPRYADEWA